MVAFLFSNLLQLQNPFICPMLACAQQLLTAMSRHITADAHASVGGLPGAACNLLGELMFMAVSVGLTEGHLAIPELQSPEGLGAKAGLAQRFVRWDASTAAAAAALEAHQRAAGFLPLLTAAQLQVLGTLLAIYHYRTCMSLQVQA